MKLTEILKKWPDDGKRKWRIASPAGFYIVQCIPGNYMNYSDSDAAYDASVAGVPLYNRDELNKKLKLFKGIIKDDEGINLQNAERTWTSK